MSKQLIKNYVFDATAKTITFPDFDTIDLARLERVTNATRGVVLYDVSDATELATVSGNVVTIKYYQPASSTDKLTIEYDTLFGDVMYDKTVVGNSRSKFRDGFATSGITQPNPATWDLVEDVPGSHIINQGGDSSGASYLRISLSPFVEGNGLSITSKKTFLFPMRVGFGISASQRIQGQEFFVGMVGTDANGTVEYTTPVADKAVTGANVVVSSNVGTITLANHGFKGGDRVNLYGFADKRMNVGPVAVTVVDVNNFTVPITIANASYSAVGGMVRTVDPLRYAKNGVGYLFENTSPTNASFVSRRNGAKFRTLNSTVATTVGVQTSTSPYTDAFNAASNQELYLTMDEVSFRSYQADANAGVSGNNKYTQGVPDEELPYKIHVRARNLHAISRPVAKVVTAAKTGTTTATVTTDVPHGLVAGDFVQIYGTRDQTNFAQLATQTAIASVPNSTSFTIVWGSAVTASTAGGAVWVNHGQVNAPGVFGQSIQSISRSNGVLTLTGNTTWSGPLAGEYAQVYGLEAAAVGYEGAYKILRLNGTALELEAPGPDFGSITTGGSVIRRTDVRLHFARVMDYTRLGVEVLGGKGNTSDINNSTAVSIVGGATLGVSQQTGSASNIWNAAGYGGSLANDVVSAAITSTATTSAITPGLVSNIGTYAHSFNVVVTAVTGTTPTMDIGVEESMDNGVNWVRIYDFPRITANGAYTSPLIKATYGTRFRYVQTIGGTTPSFTRAINRVMFSVPGQFIKQFFDRSIVLTTLNSTTPTYTVDGGNFFQTIVNLGAATTPPVLQLQGSEDGTNWYNIGTTFTPTASATTVTVNKDISPKFARILVQTAGNTVTAGYVSLKVTGVS